MRPHRSRLEYSRGVLGQMLAVSDSQICLYLEWVSQAQEIFDLEDLLLARLRPQNPCVSQDQIKLIDPQFVGPSLPVIFEELPNGLRNQINYPGLIHLLLRFK